MKYYVELKNGDYKVFENELKMYKFLYEFCAKNNVAVICYGKLPKIA